MTSMTPPRPEKPETPRPTLTGRDQPRPDQPAPAQTPALQPETAQTETAQTETSQPEASQTGALLTEALRVLDAEGTYAAILAQNARLDPAAVTTALAALRGTPTDPEAADPPLWQPASDLARWAQDKPQSAKLGQPLPIELAARRSKTEQGESLQVQLRRAPGISELPPKMAQLDLYVNGRLARELALSPLGSPLDTPTGAPDCGCWQEISLPEALRQAPVVLELCQVNRVLIETRLEPLADTAPPPRPDGGFSGIRHGILTLWAVDRADLQRPVPVTLDWQGQSHSQTYHLLPDRPDPASQQTVFTTSVPLATLPEGEDLALALSSLGVALQRGSFHLRRQGDWFLVWRLTRPAGGGIHVTLVPYRANHRAPQAPLLVTPEVPCPTSNAAPLWRGSAQRANQPDQGAFFFGEGHYSLTLDPEAPGLSRAFAEGKNTLKLHCRMPDGNTICINSSIPKGGDVTELPEKEATEG